MIPPLRPNLDGGMMPLSVEIPSCPLELHLEALKGALVVGEEDISAFGDDTTGP